MSDFYQDGTISTLHDFGTKSTKDLEKDLLNFSKERKMELILPCLYSGLKGDALSVTISQAAQKARKDLNSIQDKATVGGVFNKEVYFC